MTGNPPPYPATLLLGANVLTGGVELPATAVLIGAGKVLALGREARRLARRHGARRLDLGGHYVAPGLVDIHTHGAVGVDFVDAGSLDFERAMHHYLSRGVTTLLTSLYPSSLRQSAVVLERLARYIRSGVGGGVAAGIHLEGPYLSRARPGALPARHFRDFSTREVDTLLKAGGGLVKTMTLAPERPGGVELVRHLRRRRVIPAFGHSDADYEETRHGIQAGIRYVTHLFNAMRAMHHRAPGPVAAFLEDARVAVELIADGYHVDLPVLKLVRALKPRERIVLVSDSVRPCGLKPGSYQFAGSRVYARNGRVTLKDGTLAGSLLNLDEAVALSARKLGLPAAEAVLLATGNPARVLGLERSRGALLPGRRADLVLFDRALRVRATWLAGEQVHGDRL